ncbi:MAG: hypothetical protein ACT4OF_06235 [Caulobacteraceae bacterium]
MTSFAPVEPAPAPAPSRDQHRAPADYGAALSHRDMVQEKLRVDPASLAAKKRPSADVRTSDPPRENYDTEEREPAGQYVDIEA